MLNGFIENPVSFDAPSGQMNLITASAGFGLDGSGYGNSDEILLGNSSIDYILGGEGADILFGGLGDDQLFGQKGKDYINGGGGDDIVIGGDGDDTLIGGSGNDVIVGGDGFNILKGGDGNDILAPSLYDNVEVGSGDDIIWIADGGLINISDGDSSDSIIWNGYQLTGGNWVVVEEETLDFETEDGAFQQYYAHATHLDSNGIAYEWQTGDSGLSIWLPDTGVIFISNFQNGDFGINLEEGTLWDAVYDPGTPRGALANDFELVQGINTIYSYDYQILPDYDTFSDGWFAPIYGQYAANNAGPVSIPDPLIGWI